MSSTKELNFVGNPSEDLLCQICTKVFVEPHVTDCCGQHFCEQCLTKWFQGGKVCPHCRSTNFSHIRYLPLKRKINDLQVYCSNWKDGCTTITSVSGLDDHLIECLYATVKCSYKCGQSIFRKDLTDHTTNMCRFRRSTCVYCQKQDRYFVIVGIQHLNRCPDFPVGCPKNCSNGSTVKRKDLPSHRLVCQLESINCPDCRVNLLRQELCGHLLTACPKRMVKCKYCQKEMKYDSTSVHELSCPEYPVTCPRRCDLGSRLKRKDLKHHEMVVCPLEPETCKGCSRIIVRKDMDDHCAKECPKRPTTCTHCKKSGPYDNITGIHMGECEECPIGCPRKCKGSEQIKRKELKTHAEVCLLEPVRCPFNEVGCNPQLVRRDLNNHVKSNMDKHIIKVMTAHSSLVAEHKKLQNDHYKLQDDYCGLKSELAAMKKKHSDMEAKINSMTSSQKLESKKSDKDGPVAIPCFATDNMPPKPKGKVNLSHSLELALADIQANSADKEKNTVI